MEKILWETKPHFIRYLWLLIPRFILWFIAVTLLTQWALIWGSIAIWLGAAILLVALVGVTIYVYYLWNTINYRMTDEGLYFTWGLLYKIKKFIPHYKITNYTDTQGIIQQLLKIESIRIHTAGTGTNFPELIISDIVKAKSDKLTVVLTKKIKEIRSRGD